MLRRVKFKLRTGGIDINHRRVFNELFIVFLALLTFMTLSYLSPVIVHRFKRKAQKDILPNSRVMRMRTRPRSVVKSEQEGHYTGHSPYVSDAITELVFNAKACPGSPPIPLASDKEQRKGRDLADNPLSYVNLIYSKKHGKDNGQDHEQTGTRHSSDRSSTHHQQNYDALFIVCSNVKYWANRDYFRQIYGNASNTWPYRIKVVFLLGLPKDPEVMKNVSKEASLFSDIVMGSFLDHYDNLTYKTILGFRWIHAHCRNMKLMLKIDDDVFVDVFKFFDMFQPLVKKQTRTINCFLNKSPRVHREGKYQVFKEEFNEKMYPSFCSGFFVVFPLDVVDSYVSLYKNIRFFRLEDVFSYGMLRQAMVDVQLIHLDQVTVESNEYIKCITRYKYRCKYMAAQVKYTLLPVLMDKMAQYRLNMGLYGTQSGVDELVY